MTRHQYGISALVRQQQQQQQLRCDFEGTPVVASRDVGCFLRLKLISGCIFCRKITMEFVFTFFNHTINFVSLPFLRRPMIFPVCFSHFSEEFICSVYFFMRHGQSTVFLWYLFNDRCVWLSMHCATLASISKRLRPTGSFTSAIKCFLWENFTSELKRDLNPSQENANKRYS